MIQGTPNIQNKFFISAIKNNYFKCLIVKNMLIKMCLGKILKMCDMLTVLYLGHSDILVNYAVLCDCRTAAIRETPPMDHFNLCLKPISFPLS